MRRLLLGVAALVFFSLACVGQTGSGDSAILQALLKEVQQIRGDIRSSTASAQRSQILVYRLEDEEAAVGRASQRLDTMRASLDKVQSERKMVELNIKQDEDFQNAEDTPAAQRKSVESTLAEFKTRLESLQIEEQAAQAHEIDAEQKLQSEEMRLAELRADLEGLDKSLENAYRVNRSAP